MIVGDTKLRMAKVSQSLRIHYPIQVDDDCVFTQLKLDGEEVDTDYKLVTIIIWINENHIGLRINLITIDSTLLWI